MLFDSRIGQLSSSKTVTLDPTWDCKVPLNVNDSDLRPEMKEPPTHQGSSTEALFAIVRSEVADFVRYSEFHLDFTSPALKVIAKQRAQDKSGSKCSDLSKLEAMIEDRYFKSCDPDNPSHFMTIWTTRSYLAKCRLMDHHSKYSSSCIGWTPLQREGANSHALRMLECDTKVMTSPLTVRFRWFNHFYFPFLAYIHIVQDFKRRPNDETARQAWEVMSDNCDAWLSAMIADGESPVLKLFGKFIFEAWEVCEAATARNGETPMPTPRIVSNLKETLARLTGSAWSTPAYQPDTNMVPAFDNLAMPMPPTGFNDQSQLNPMPFQGDNPMMASGVFPGAYGRGQMDWTALGGWPGWGSF